jgi:hypothetical protein
MRTAGRARTGGSRIADQKVTGGSVATARGNVARTTVGKATAEPPDGTKKPARMIRTGLIFDRDRSVTSACAPEP